MYNFHFHDLFYYYISISIRISIISIISNNFYHCFFS